MYPGATIVVPALYKIFIVFRICSIQIAISLFLNYDTINIACHASSQSQQNNIFINHQVFNILLF